MKEGITNWTNRSEIVHGHWTEPEEIPEYRVRMIEEIIRELDKNKAHTIMDCGCGTGLLFKYLPDEYKDRYYGVDFTQEMIEFCHEHYPEHKDRFRRLDLTNPAMIDYDYFHGHAIYVSQNVIQHILLFQEALDNIFYGAESMVLLCERTHFLASCIVGYEPAFRWRYNVQDFYEILQHFKEKYAYLGPVEILGHPITTNNREKAVTMFRVYREISGELTPDELKEYREKYLIRKRTIIREWKPQPTKWQRVKRFLRSIFFTKTLK